MGLRQSLDPRDHTRHDEGRGRIVESESVDHVVGISMSVNGRCGVLQWWLLELRLLGVSGDA